MQVHAISPAAGPLTRDRNPGIVPPWLDPPRPVDPDSPRILPVPGPIPIAPDQTGAGPIPISPDPDTPRILGT